MRARMPVSSDRELQTEILAALEMEPRLDAARIGVSVRHGVATLQGAVESLGQKWTAEQTAQQVWGVRAVANDIDVTADGRTARSDPAIAEAVADALSCDATIPVHAVQAAVRQGLVSLTGAVCWPYQRMAAERAVCHLAGVRAVSNAILLKPPTPAAEAGPARAACP
jgi:osmotically-inducible protein OsmY